MVDFLFAVGQFVCFIGLLYGLILTIVHGDCVDTLQPHYDPIAGHDWLALRIAPYRRHEPPRASSERHDDATAPFAAHGTD